MSALDLVRTELRQLRGYSSARMEASGGRVLLNANESPWPGIADPDGTLQRYPDAQQPADLVAGLADLYGVPAANVLVARGSDECIDLLTRATCRAGVDAVLVSPPTFAMYAVCAGIQGASVLNVPLDPARDFAPDFRRLREVALAETVKLVYVCTPNNPTGGIAPAEPVLALARELAGRALVVVDEAYAEFADAPSLAPRAAQPGNLVVLRTLSKAHALAGARVGALVADAGLVALLRRLLAPYPIAVPCARAALAALAPDALAATRLRVAAIRAERTRLAGAFARLPGVRAVFPSAANFLTARLDAASATYAALLAAGIVVRDVGGYPGLEDCLRFTIGTPGENDALLGVLARRERVA